MRLETRSQLTTEYTKRPGQPGVIWPFSWFRVTGMEPLAPSMRTLGKPVSIGQARGQTDFHDQSGLSLVGVVAVLFCCTAGGPCWTSLLCKDGASCRRPPVDGSHLREQSAEDDHNIPTSLSFGCTDGCTVADRCSAADPMAVRPEAYSRVRRSWISRLLAMVHRALLALRLRRWRSVLPRKLSALAAQSVDGAVADALRLPGLVDKGEPDTEADQRATSHSVDYTAHRGPLQQPATFGDEDAIGKQPGEREQAKHQPKQHEHAYGRGMTCISRHELRQQADEERSHLWVGQIVEQPLSIRPPPGRPHRSVRVAGRFGVSGPRCPQRLDAEVQQIRHPHDLQCQKGRLRGA